MALYGDEWQKTDTVCPDPKCGAKLLRLTNSQNLVCHSPCRFIYYSEREKKEYWVGEKLPPDVQKQRDEASKK